MYQDLQSSISSNFQSQVEEFSSTKPDIEGQ